MKIEAMSAEGLRYLACFPSDFSEGKKYPVIIHLHGAGSRGTDLEVLKNQAVVRYAKEAKDFPFVLLLPLCEEFCWFDVFERLKALVTRLLSLPFVDPERAFLSGVSMGGYAGWQMLMSKNGAFRKAVLCCGGGIYGMVPHVKAEVWAFHGTDDPTVFFEESRKMVDAVNRGGGRAKLTSYEGVGHNCWDLTYSNPEIYEWLLS